jgi:hypothetical protein
MARRGGTGSGEYHQAYKVRSGWQLWVGDAWAEVIAVRISGDYVLLTIADGRVFRAGYVDAVLTRATPPGPLTPADSRGISGIARWRMVRGVLRTAPVSSGWRQPPNWSSCQPGAS